MARSSMENPAPPYPAGMNDLVNPACAISRYASRPARNDSHPPTARSIGPAAGPSTPSANALAFFCSSCWLSLSVKSMATTDTFSLSRSYPAYLFPHAQPAADLTIVRAFARPGDGFNTLKHGRLLQFVAQAPEHLVLHGKASAPAHDAGHGGLPCQVVMGLRMVRTRISGPSL